jgi:hypothetical protein
MASIKRFEEFVSEMDRAEEIEQEVIDKGTPEVKSEEEAEEEAEEVQGIDEAGEAIIGDDAKKIKEETKPVADLLKDCYEAVIKEAKAWEEDAHDEHTVETYMAENAALVAGMAANCVKEMKEDMASEAYEACLNKMSEAFTKKINESKEATAATDADDIN